MQAKIKQRRAIKLKCQAIDRLCGDYWRSAEAAADQPEEVEEVDQEAVVTRDLLATFRLAAGRVVERVRCQNIIAIVLSLKRERDNFERLCFTFVEDEASTVQHSTVKDNDVNAAAGECSVPAVPQQVDQHLRHLGPGAEAGSAGGQPPARHGDPVHPQLPLHHPHRHPGHSGYQLLRSFAYFATQNDDDFSSASHSTAPMQYFRVPRMVS